MDPKLNTSKHKRSASMESASTEVKVVASSRSDFLGRTPDPPKMVSNVSKWIDMSLFIVKGCPPRLTPDELISKLAVIGTNSKGVRSY